MTAPVLLGIAMLVAYIPFFLGIAADIYEENKFNKRKRPTL